MTIWDRRTVPPEAAQGIVLPEGGFKLRPYRDSVGYPTIGAGSRKMPDGSPVTMASRAISPAEAEAMFNRQAISYCPLLAAAVPQELRTFEAAALMSLIHNCGPGVVQGSIIQKAIAARRMDAAVQQFGGWCVALNPNTGRHEPSLGLMHRRDMDALVWAGMDPLAAWKQAYGPHALTFSAGMVFYNAAQQAARTWGWQADDTAAAGRPAPAGKPVPQPPVHQSTTTDLNNASWASTQGITS